MNRRNFINTLSATAVAMMIGGSSESDAAPRLAITMDDPNLNQTPKLSADERNQKILEALDRHGGLKAALFVCGMRVDNNAGKSLLDQWNQRGHIIANHSYSHRYYHSSKITVEQFIEDAVKGEHVIEGFSRFRKLFRFPFLKEGDTIEKRDRMRAFLKERGYKNGAVTIDASDWYVDERLGKRLLKDPGADITPYRDFYLKHIWDRARFYDDLARKAIGRSVNHTLLIHHSLLNALFLGDLLDMFKAKGWQPINAEEAFKDKVFSAAPNTLPAGESLIWAMAKQSGKFDKQLRYPGEDGEYEKAEMDRLGL